jgi:glucosamine-phosphate N-acetyltransferase
MRIRKLNRSDYNSYISLLDQLTEVGSVTNSQFNLYVDNQSQLHQTLVYEEDNQLLGCLTYFCEQKVHHSFSYVIHIEDVVTDAKHRGKGVAKTLIDNAIKIAKAFKCYKVILNCSDRNTDYYKKLGFQLVGNQMVIKF